MTWNIRISMVQNIMLNLPIINITSKNVNAAAHKFIDPIFIRIRTMIAIVHNIHADSCHSNTDNY